MAYQIIPKSIKDFVNMPTKLPRFQRKKTWTPQQNFNLCISIFKNYPIGVVVINNAGGTYWVLDGRQRLEALRQMSNNPEAVYLWAQKFIKFKLSEDEQTIRTKFYKQISNYLEKAKFEDGDKKSSTDDSYDSQGDLEDSIDETDISFEETSFSTDEQKNNFKVLLDLILMVHKMSSGENSKSKWQRLFDFSSMFDRLPYYKESNGKVRFDPTALTQEIHKILNYSDSNRGGDSQYPLVSRKTFENYFLGEINGRPRNDRCKQDFISKIDDDWESIYKSIETIKKADKIIRDSIIGIIELTKASNLDAQNIFELINKGGTKLTAEELLSAKPYWNVVVNNVSKEALERIKSLYENLDVEYQNDVVRWDLCATLISRLNKAKFIFGQDINLANEDTLKTYTTLGFKLFSAIQIGGINNVSVASIETRKDFNWENEYESFVSDLNQLSELIGSHPYFTNMINWNSSIRTLLSDAISLEFLALMYKEWLELGKPQTTSAAGKQLRRSAVILIDKLIYEYSNRVWRGSSDSKLSRDLLDRKERLKPKNIEDWTKLVSDLSEGMVNDHPATQKDIAPVLYHFLFLSDIVPYTSAKPPYHLDHIIPQSLFEGNPLLSEYKKDSLINLQVLSSEANESKKDKKLSAIQNNAHKAEITRASGIEESEFDFYSNISNYNSLKEKRKKLFFDVLENKRPNMLGGE